MSEYVQITLIICSTIIILSLINYFKKDNEVGKSPRERYRGYQPNARALHGVDMSQLNNISKPPSIGSGIK